LNMTFSVTKLFHKYVDEMADFIKQNLIKIRAYILCCKM